MVRAFSHIPLKEFAGMTCIKALSIISLVKRNKGEDIVPVLHLIKYDSYLQNKILFAGLDILQAGEGDQTCVDDPTAVKQNLS